jgi:hypothetical protein
LGFSAVELLQGIGRRKARKAARHSAGRYGMSNMLAQGGFEEESLPKKRSRDAMDDLASDNEEEEENADDVATEFAMATIDSVFSKFDSLWDLLRCSFGTSAPEMSTRWLTLCDILIRVLEQDWQQRKTAAAGMSALEAAAELDRACIVEQLRDDSGGFPPYKIARALLMDLRCGAAEWPLDPWRPSASRKRSPTSHAVSVTRRMRSTMMISAGREDACFSDLVEQSGASVAFANEQKNAQGPNSDDDEDQSGGEYKSQEAKQLTPSARIDDAADQDGPVMNSAALWVHPASLPLRIRLMNLIADAATTLASASGQPTSVGKRTGKLLHFSEQEWLNALAQEIAGARGLSGSTTGAKHLGQILALLDCLIQAASLESDEVAKTTLLKRGEILCALMLTHCSTFDPQGSEGRPAPSRSNLFKAGIFSPGERSAALFGARTAASFTGRATPGSVDWQATGRVAVLKTYLLLFAAMLRHADSGSSSEESALLVMDEGQLATRKMILEEELQQAEQVERDSRLGSSGQGARRGDKAEPVKLSPINAYRRREFRSAARRCSDMLLAI